MAQTTEERIAQIAQGFGQGLQNFMQIRNQNEAKTLQQEALKRQRALQMLDVANSLSSQSGRMIDPNAIAPMIESGNFQGIGELMKSAPLTHKAQQEQMERERKRQRENLQDEKTRKEIEEMSKPFEETRDYKKAVAIQDIKTKGKKQATPKQNEFAAAGYATRARQAVDDLNKLAPDIGTGFSDTFNNMIPNYFKGQDTKLFEQAKRNFITANLRKESGATIGDDEYAIEEAKYFPMPGDSQAVLAQKSAAREQAIKNLEAEGNNALSMVTQQPIQTMQASPVRVTPQQVQTIKQMSDEELLRFVQGG